MKLQAVLFFFLAVYRVFAQTDRNRDGLIDSVPGYAISYYSARYEPLCGTITSISAPLDAGTQCINAIVRYTNDTRSTLAFYDTAGVKLVNIGVGMGRALCMCFAMATNTAVAYDMCWYFNEIGQYLSDGGGWMIGSYRPGAAKSLPSCGNVDVDQLEQQWTATAVMPQATGPVETVNLGPSTVLQTVTQISTSTLTPTMVNLTISSSTVVTGRDGNPTTEDRSYTTTAAVINFEPAPDQGMSLGNRIALGVGLGLGLPTLFLALVACWRAGRAPPPVPPKNNPMFQRRDEY